MKVISSLIKSYPFELFLGFLFLFSFAIRVYKIDSLSPVITHDEVYYVAESKTISLDGQDLTGTQTPLALKPANPLFAELPGAVMSVGHWMFPQSPFIAARITHVFLGSLLSVVLAGFSLSLFKDKKLAMIVGIIAMVNPWLFQNSRMSFDAIFSLFFYFSGLWILLTKKNGLLLIAGLLLLVGFYQYQGLKILLIPILFIIFTYIFSERWVAEKQPQLKKELKKIWPQIAFFIFFCLLFVVHLLRLKNTGASGRVDDLIFFNTEFIAAQLNVKRQQAIQTPLNRFIINDVTTIASVFIEKYLDAFDLNQLFLHINNRRNPFAVWSHGVFYLIDLPLMMIGAWILTKEKKWRLQSLLFLSFILIAPLPSAINSQDTWQFFRASWLFPLGVILSSVGIWAVFQFKYRWLSLGLIALYSASVLLFAFAYFVRYPIFGSTDRYLSQRVLARYIQELKPLGKPIMVYAEEPYFTFTTLITLGNDINKENLDNIHSAYQNKSYSLNRLKVVGSCVSLADLESSIVIADTRIPLCEGSSREQTPIRTTIPSLIDSGAYFMIYNDPLCVQYGLPTFSHITTDVFAIESLSDETFCRSFFAEEK